MGTEMSDWKSRAKPLKMDMPPVAVNGYAGDSSIRNVTEQDIMNLISQKVAEQPIKNDWRSRAKPIQIAPVETVAEPIVEAKPGFFGRVGEDWKKRVGNVVEGIEAQDKGKQTGAETFAQLLGAGGNLMFNDVPGEIITSAWNQTPNFIKNPIRQGASNVLSAAANLPAGHGYTVGETTKFFADQANQFLEDNPRTNRNLRAVGGIGSAALAFTPIKGQSAVGSAVDVAETGGKLVVKGADKIRPALGAEQKLLQNLGVRLTSGQRGGGIAQAIENKATSIPIVGDMINASYKRGIEDFNKVVSDDVLSSIGKKLPKTVKPGRDAVSHVYDEIGNSYDDILSKMVGKIDNDFAADKAAAFQKAALLPKEKASQAKRIIDDAVNLRLSGKTVKGGDNKEIMRRLKHNANKYSKSPDPDQQLMGEIFQDMHSAYSDMLQRNNPPELAQRLKDTDLAFAKYVRLEKAAASTGSDAGVFTAPQLVQAVKSTDNSVRKGQFARGDALLQELAEAGKKVLPNKVPDSGTAGRLGLGLLLGGGAAYLNPLLLGGGALAAAAYTRPGQVVLRGASKIIRK